MLAKIVATTLVMHVVVVMASLTAPVLASLLAAAAGVPPYLIGYYSALVYGVGAMVSLATPGLVRRYGVIRLHQLILGATALALAALAGAGIAAYAVSGLLLGLAYGPVNPASTVILARFTPPARHARIFSIKQTAVPLGGALAGSIMPRLAQAIGWRPAVLLLAALAVVLIVSVQRRRDALDRGNDPRARVFGAALWAPVRLYLQTPGLHLVAGAAFAFGAVQFTETALFATVLTEAGWKLAEAGGMLSFALALSVPLRVMWGWVADWMTPRLVLGLLGAVMSGVAAASAFLGPAWPTAAVLGLSVLLSLSAFCWNGIALAQSVRQVPPGAIAEASAGLYTLSFAGALVGPAAFSSVTLVTGSFRLAYLGLAAMAVVPSGLLLWPRAATLRPMPVPPPGPG